MIARKDWKPITANAPKEGETVIVYNGIRALVTHFKLGLCSTLAQYPMTHYAPLELPYAPITADVTAIEPDIGRQRISKGAILSCTVPGCGLAHHAKGLCVIHYMRRAK